MVVSVRLQYLLKDVLDNIQRAEHAENLGDYLTAQQQYLYAAEGFNNVAKLLSFDAEEQNLRLRQSQAMRERAEACAKMVAGVAQKNTKNLQNTTTNSPKPYVPQVSSPSMHKVENREDDEAEDFSVVHSSDMLTFSDVVGQESLIEEIRLRMIEPLFFPELAKKVGMKIGGGVLMYGPPGTGKTHIAKAVAGEVDAVFYNIKASDLMNQFVGNTEKSIAKLFARARQHQRAIIFLDEIEALVPKRKGQSSTVMARVVPQFLAEMDGFSKNTDNTLMVIGATNEPWAIDSAILRPGRFDIHIYVGLPDKIARAELLKRHLSHRATDIENYEALADDAEGLSGADIAEIGNSVARMAFKLLKENPDSLVPQSEVSNLLHKQKRSISEKQLAEFKKWQQ